MKQCINTVSKLSIFLVFIFALGTSYSCKKPQYDVIPYVNVNFRLNLMDSEFLPLQAPANYILVDASTNNLGYAASGYDGNGIIVYRASMDEFFAFDRTCPHDYALDNSSVAIDTITGEFYVKCPKCGSEYVLPSFGSPTKDGPSKYPLKNYRTNFDGQYVHVYN